MRDYVEDIIPDHQFGFREGHGTPEQCHRIVDYIRKSFEDKQYCVGAFLDVTKAFDKVWHLGLLYKLRGLLSPYLFVLLRSYLSKRSFYVQVGDGRSQVGEIGSGVPQGSVLGPHLYVIYTSDMPTLRDGINATFADDTAFLISSEDPHEASTVINQHLEAFSSWAKRWNIRVNAEKSQHITFTLGQEDSPQVDYDGLGLPHCHSVRYLGLHLDRRLTFHNHITKKRKELDLTRKKYYYIINKNSNLSLRNKLLIYNSILKPVWTYCLPLWGLASDSNIKIIQRFQNISLRVITGALNYISNDTLHTELQIKGVKEEIHLAAMRHRNRLENHRNNLANSIMLNSLTQSRLKKKMFCRL